jgi:uncharacterized protein (TIGR00369 family)
MQERTPVITDQKQQLLDTTRRRVHAHCVACGGMDGQTLRLRFVPRSEGSVEAVYQPSPRYEGYGGFIHGGVTATLLDAAMTNCLFAHGLCAVTAELNVRYRHPVGSGITCLLLARLERCTAPLYVLHAELLQNDRVCATAAGKFMELPRGVCS